MKTKLLSASSLFTFAMILALVFGLFNFRASASAQRRDDVLRRVETLRMMYDTIEYLKSSSVYDIGSRMDQLQSQWHEEVKAHERWLEEPEKPVAKADYTVEQICRAIAMHETADCTNGSAITHNNCVGLKECYGGRCYGFQKFLRKEDSLIACEKAWRDGYGARVPTKADADAWSGKDRATAWYNNVHLFLSQM